MKTSTLLSKVFRNRSHNRRGRGHINRLPALENLESRQMLTAGLMWDGDALHISGSASDDFIAVQQDELGLKVFTQDAIFSEYEGRSLNEASAIHVDGNDGNDVLLSYATEIPVILNGGSGNDFLFSDTPNDTVDGDEGWDWIHTNDVQGTGDDAFGISGFNLDSDTLTVTPEFDNEGRIGLLVDVEGETTIAGLAIDVIGTAGVTSQGVNVAVTGSVSKWDDAFGIGGIDLTDSSVTISAGNDVNEGDGYRVELNSTLDVSGTAIGVAGVVDVQAETTAAAFVGTVAHWDDAFGIPELDLTDSLLTGSGFVDSSGHQELSFTVDADLQIEDTLIDVAGRVDLTPNRTEVTLEGSVTNWDDAFGVTGMDLLDSDFTVTAFTDHQEDYDLQIELTGDLEVDDTKIGISGQVDIAPDQIDAVFSGSVDNWDDAFGIEGFDLNTADLSVAASTNRVDENQLRIDLTGEMDVRGTAASVSGSLDLDENRIAGSLMGSVANDWIDAFGIDGLTLKDTQLTVEAVRDEQEGNTFGIGLNADIDLFGTAIDVTGDVNISGNDVYGSLTGIVAGTWSAAFGIGALHLNDTIVRVSGRKSSEGSELQVGVTAGMNVFGTDLSVSGTVDIKPDSVVSNLTSFVSGEWQDAFGIPGLQLKDTDVSVGSSSESSSLDIDLDTDLQLFGSYIDVLGELDISPSGIDLTFSPPTSLGFTDLLGISGFTLDNADLDITAGTDGLAVAIRSTMAFGELDVDFEGEFSVGRSEVQASLTGRVAEWDNAFEVPGLNLNDVVLTLGAESGAGGASLYVGVGAGIGIGQGEMRVAGLVGLGSTGWEVAFRGSIDSLTGDDVIDFANTLNRANDPSAVQIPDGALGDIELREAFINFAPNGGNEELGIENGFGLGGSFYDDGKLLGSGEFIVDMAKGVFEVGLEIPELDLGPVDLNDVVVDLRLSPTDSHYRVGGTATLMGAHVFLEGFVSRDNISLRGEAGINVQGLSASAEFIVDQSGVQFIASVSGDFINDAKSLATRDLRTAANAAQMLIDEAQDGVDFAQRGVDKLEAELQEAREEAQEVVDEVKADIAKAKSLVDKAKSSMDYWSRQRSSRYKAWRSAVAKTNSVKWYQKPKYKAIEVARYSSYAYSVTRHTAQKGVYYGAKATYTAVRNAAGWVLDTAGVEANPKVVGLKALVFTANTGLNVAETLLGEVEKANQGVLSALDTFDSIKVNRITFGGRVSNFTDSGLMLEIDCSIGGRNHLISLNASPDDLAEELAKKLISIVL